MRKNRQSIKIQLLILAIVIVLFVLLLFWKSKSQYQMDVYSENYIPVDEIKQELGFFLYTEEEWDQFFDAYQKEYLTVEMEKGLLNRLGVSEYIEGKKGTANTAITRAEWNETYGQILDYLDTEKKISRGTVLVLGTLASNIENVIFTNQTDVYTRLPVTYFEQWKAYEFYYMDGKCVGIYGISGEECKIANAYLTSAAENEAAFLFGGSAYKVKADGLEEAVAPGVCDLIFVNGRLCTIRQKQDSIQGKLLSYDENVIEIEGYGKIKHEGKLPVYQVYDEVAEKSISDVVLGNMEAEYIIGTEEVCAILIRQPANIQDIRVLLLADGSRFHENVWLKCSTDAILKCGKTEQSISAGTVIWANDYVKDDSETLSLTPQDNGKVFLCDENGETVSNGYYGIMETRACEEGYTLVNCVPLETYLCAVVPSEMPSSYEPEALKAQAVCARSYAYIQLMRADLAAFGAHIDDSTSYQVYNKTAESEASIKAVKDTEGMVMTYHGNVIEAYYFSTSMGYTDTAAVWNAADDASYGYLKQVCLNQNEFSGDLSKEADFKTYLETESIGYDSDIKFYRWQAKADYREKMEEINTILENRHSVSAGNVIYYESDGETEADSVENLGKFLRFSVKERSTSGTILTLLLQYEEGSVEVKSEYNIRKILGCGVSQINFMDGSEKEDMTILPSAACLVEYCEDGTCLLTGGGYGHGLGMSQNGANGLAKAGYNYADILNYFYQQIEIEDMRTGF